MYKWKHRWKRMLLVAAGYLLIFLSGKLLSGNPGLSLWQWLLDRTSVHYSYLYGWLIHHGWFLYASLISISAAILGKNRFAYLSLFGFAFGLALGEFLGQSAIPYIHYGWAIWGLLFLISCIMGAVLERFPKYEISLRSNRFRSWLAVYLILFAGILIFVRAHMI